MEQQPAGADLVGGPGAGAFGYSVDATGALHLVPGSPFAAGVGPSGVSIEPNDSLVYIVNGGSSNVSAFHFNNQTAKLTPVAGSPFAAGAFAAGISTASEPTHE